jgi:hypothetical protein
MTLVKEPERRTRCVDPSLFWWPTHWSRSRRRFGSRLAESEALKVAYTEVRVEGTIEETEGIICDILKQSTPQEGVR